MISGKGLTNMYGSGQATRRAKQRATAVGTNQGAQNALVAVSEQGSLRFESLAPFLRKGQVSAKQVSRALRRYERTSVRRARHLTALMRGAENLTGAA
jgi:hypothetical protein